MQQMLVRQGFRGAGGRGVKEGFSSYIEDATSS